MELKVLQLQVSRFIRKISGIEQDMSSRIMYSILPSLADPSQVALTGGVVDYKALKTAIAGSKNIIKYGVKAVIEELTNSRGDPRTANLVQYLANSDQLEAAMNLAITTFGNPALWMESYGGRAWEQIARSLRQMIRLNIQLAKLNAAKDITPDAYNQEVQLMRDLIVEMNIFDGLSHNSDSILRNIVEQEVLDKKQQELDNPHIKEVSDTYDNAQNNYRRIKRLMDAKELEEPSEVFKLISPTLEESGDINKFKDWVHKMRRSDTFRKSDPEIVKKLYFIYMRKALIDNRGALNRQIDDLRREIEAFEKEPNTINEQKVMEICDYVSSLIQIVYGEFDELNGDFLAQYPEFQSAAKEIPQYLGKQIAHAKKIADKISQLEEKRYANYDGKYVDTTKLAVYKEILSLAKSLVYMLDTI